MSDQTSPTPEGIHFSDTSGDMLYVTEEGHPFRGWICYRHPDGQWVTLRNASQLVGAAEQAAREGVERDEKLYAMCCRPDGILAARQEALEEAAKKVPWSDGDGCEGGWVRDWLLDLAKEVGRA